MIILRFLNILITNYFTFWIIGFSISTYLYPDPFRKLIYLITPALGVIMFGMGITLSGQDFKRVLLRPLDVAVGFCLQYGFMPLAGFVLSNIFGLKPLLAAGVVLVGSCPGGTASNVITFLARGDVALSVTLTSVSTIMSPVLTPLFTYIYAGQWIDVPAYKLFITTIKIIILPIALGLGIKTLYREKVMFAVEFLPLLSSVAIIFIVGVIVAANAESISGVGLRTGLVVIIHNVLGLAVGFGLARLAGMNMKKAKAVSIEVGMQNSGLGVALAGAYFGALAALPAAIFSVWHNISGSALAWWWSRQEEKIS
ncbi:MAG TPA: bile acid:sodium symporter family protein [Thermodesulfobacteriota bacterium]